MSVAKENSALDRAAAEQRREYYRKWRATHKDAVKRHNQTYWRRRAEKAAQQKEGLGNAQEDRRERGLSASQ